MESENLLVWERLIIYFKGNHLLCYVRRNLIEHARKRTREKRHLGKRQLNTRKSNVDVLWSIHSHSNYEKNTKWARIFLSRHEGLSSCSILSSSVTVREDATV
jgi:hypothetical protein